MNEFSISVRPLVIAGLSAYIRHYKTLAFIVISIGYILIGAILEERKLTILCGNSYREYKRKVGMLVPFVLRLWLLPIFTILQVGLHFIFG